MSLQRRSTTTLPFLVLTVGLLASCGGDGGTDPSDARAESLDVQPELLLFGSPGATEALQVTARTGSGAQIANPDVSWSTSDASTAAVDPSGIVTAVGYGTAVIVARSGNAADTAAVSVAPASISGEAVLATTGPDGTVHLFASEARSHVKVRVATEQGAPLASSRVAIWEENGNVGLLALPAGDSLAPAVFFGPAAELGLTATGPAGVVVTAAAVGSALVVSSVALAMGKLTAALNAERKAWQRIDGYLGQQPVGQPFCASTDELVSLLRDYQIAQSGESGKVVVMSLAMAGATAYVPPGVSEAVESLMLANEVAYAEDWFDEIVTVDESELRSLWADGLGQAPGDFPFAGQRWQVWLDPIDTPQGIPTNGPRWDLERIVLVPNDPSCILPPQITTTSLPSGVVGQTYSASLSASGGDGGYEWSITQGSLPAGLSLSGSTISGTPTTPQSADFTLRVTSAGLSDTRSLGIQVSPQTQPPSITTTSLPDGTVGQSYAAGLSATGGDGNYVWSIAQGFLPAGLSLNGSSISGTPRIQQTADFTLRVTSAGLNATRPLSIDVGPAPSSERLAFRRGDLSGGDIYTIGVDGLNPTNLTPNSSLNPYNPDWSPDGARIVFDVSNGSGLYTVGSDGSLPVLLVADASLNSFDPEYSPDGSRIAFGMRGFNDPGGLFVANADGTNISKIYSGRADQPSWSPDGTQLAFRCEDFNICTVGLNGTGLAQITSSAGGPTYVFSRPAWSPDGVRIAFARRPWVQGGVDNLFSMDTDGTNVVQLTNGAWPDSNSFPAWSPDGTRIAYSFGGGIYIMNADGTAIVMVTPSGSGDSSPAWIR